MAKTKFIELHALAPEKPAYGTSCNGCGVCCAAELCPVARVYLLQLKGVCRALLWQEETRRYVCGMVVFPDHYLSLMPLRWRESTGRFFASRIAAGTGCDCMISVEIS